MARPGFVLTVDERTPPLLIGEGERLRLQTFRPGTEVVYPGEGAIPTASAEELVAAALARPLDGDPLSERLHPGTRLTVTVAGLALSPGRGIDVRRRVVEQVLELAARAGVDDVVVLVANGVGPRLTPEQLSDVLGERVVRSLLTEGRLLSHDVHDEDGCAELVDGVRLHRRLVESDLVLDVDLARTETPGRTLLAGTSVLATQRRLCGREADTPATTELLAQAVAALPLLSVRVLTDQVCYPPGLEFLGSREWEWSLRERARWFGLRRLGGLFGDQTRRSLLQAPVQRGVLAVAAGSPGPVTAWAGEQHHQQRAVGVTGQADVLVAGVPHRTRWNPDAAVDPLVAAWSVLVDTLGASTPTSALRPGGTVIAFHPLRGDFSSRVHPASADFFADVLPGGTDAETVAGHEERFATDQWYASRYRQQHAHAGVSPFQLWYAVAAAREQVGDVIWVGGDRTSAERMGFRAASTLADALEIAAGTVGRTPRVRYLRTPPSLLTEVGGV